MESRHLELATRLEGFLSDRVIGDREALSAVVSDADAGAGNVVDFSAFIIVEVGFVQCSDDSRLTPAHRRGEYSPANVAIAHFR